MDDQVLLWILLALGCLCLLAVLPYLIYALLRMFAIPVSGFSDLFSGGLQVLQESVSTQQLRRELAGQISKRQSSAGRPRLFRKPSENEDVYTAAAVLKDKMRDCCDIHHFSAEVLGITHMRELQDHMICNAHRTRVLDLTDYALELVASRQLLADATLSKMAIGLDATRDVCAHCMLLSFARNEAPHLCDPAKFMGCQEGEPSK